MFAVTEVDAAPIRAAYEQRGEFAAAIELHRRFLGIVDADQARQYVRIIALLEADAEAEARAPQRATDLQALVDRA